jgi:hypothetical protein
VNGDEVMDEINWRFVAEEHEKGSWLPVGRAAESGQEERVVRR